MCGIFGLLASENAALTPGVVLEMTNHLFRLSESRGKEAAGAAIRTPTSLLVCKTPASASHLIRSHSYRRLFHDAFDRANGSVNRGAIGVPFAVLGHSRLVTSGAQGVNDNNQPVFKDGALVVHNGIIVNDDSIWREFPSMTRLCDVDTEVIPSLIQHFRREGRSLAGGVQATFRHIEGAASIAVLFSDTDSVALATNTGSLYTCTSETRDILVFASEEYILDRLARKRPARRLLGRCPISQVKPSQGYIVGLADLNTEPFGIKEDPAAEVGAAHRDTPVVNVLDLSDPGAPSAPRLNTGRSQGVSGEVAREFDRFTLSIAKLRRCTRCVLPDTMPFIEFDDAGVCNYCRNHRPIHLKGGDALEAIVDTHRRSDGRPDCLVSFSGGRDSSYALHHVKNVLGMNPVAYSYDWGMLTDLARRNQSRVCSKMGVEHILLSADITRKREFIRKNVQAWLRKPDLGTVPLFMAGDKQYFYYANKLAKRTGVELIIMGMNLLEKTDFKTGFCGVRPTDLDRVGGSSYSIPPIDKARLAAYYGRRYLSNPAYINSSLWDTVFAFFSYYLISHSFLNIYQYIPWDEDQVVPTLIENYDWETAGDYTSTWRIGDGTASFYNYIYYVGAGFTENDTFRSNQIREGRIGRADALRSVEEENQPRYESIGWYCDTIGIELEATLRTINAMPKRYDS